jgi:hypothetical protein
VTADALIIAASWAYLLLATSVQALFGEVVSQAGLLAAAFYILTALATVACYRHRILASTWDAVLAGLLPLVAAGFPSWIMAKPVQEPGARAADG